MINRGVRTRLLASTIFAGALVAAAPVQAQAAADAPPAATTAPGYTSSTSNASAGPAVGQTPDIASGAASPAGTGDVVITGSRLRSPNLESAAPITVLNSQEVKLQGTTRVEDLVNSLPSVFAGQGGNISNGSSGTATLDLRGLGATRTLILVNGRRLIPGDPSTPSADINFIPTGMIKRIDALTGGASTVYGSDAVAGVINFILDTDFEGFRVDGQYSFFQHHNDVGQGVSQAIRRRGFPDPTGENSVDGQQLDTTVSFGARIADGRGHVTAYFGYRNINPVTQNDRDYSACSLSGRPNAFSCGGSGTNATGRFILGNTNTTYTVAGSSLRPYTANDAYNYAPTNYYQRSDEKYQAGAMADFEVSSAFHPYLEAMFMDDRTAAQIAPSGAFGNTSTLSCDNPLISAQELSILCAPGNIVGTTPRATGTANLASAYLFRRNVEGGPRVADLKHVDFRTVIGAKGEIAKGISYDAYYQYSRVNFSEIYSNEFSISRLNRALNVTRDPSTGQAVCQSVLDGSDTNCVPYNVFTNNAVTAAQLAYLQVPGEQQGRTTEQVATGSITLEGAQYGVKSPFASDGLGVNIGIEYRKESLSLTPDLEFQTGDLSGQGAATKAISGSYQVREGFVEASLPLVQDKPFIRLLTLNAGARRSHYDVRAGGSFNTTTYKGEVIYAPVRDISFRGSYNRAVRAPNINELFTAQNVQLDGASDPCAGTAPTASLAACQRQGVTAAQYGNILESPANQYNGLAGGNRNLTPEKADSYTVGVVLTPTFLRGFALTVDAFRIKLKNRIGVIGADTILTSCVNNSLYCNLVHRDPATGSLWLNPNGYVIDTYLNAGELKTQGIDVNGSYARSLGRFGQLSLSFLGTYLDKLNTTNVGVPQYNCAGYFGLNCGTPNPHWRHKARLTFTLPDGLGLSTQWRYFSKVHLDQTSNNAFLNVPGAVDYVLKSQSYIDFAVTARTGDNLSLRLGVNNAFDKSPPIVGSQILPGVVGNGNTFPQVYDALGRYIYVGATLAF